MVNHVQGVVLYQRNWSGSCRQRRIGEAQPITQPVGPIRFCEVWEQLIPESGKARPIVALVIPGVEKCLDKRSVVTVPSAMRLGEDIKAAALEAKWPIKRFQPHHPLRRKIGQRCHAV